MGRVKGKGKRQTVGTAQNDVGNAKEEEDISASKRRGRPQKPLKGEVEDDDEKIGNGDENGNGNGSVARKGAKDQITAANGKKRKRSSQVKESSDSVKEENGSEANSIAEEFVKSIGFRQNGSRRKNKPRRAAEVGVECN